MFRDTVQCLKTWLAEQVRAVMLKHFKTVVHSMILALLMTGFSVISFAQSSMIEITQPVTGTDVLVEGRQNLIALNTFSGDLSYITQGGLLNNPVFSSDGRYLAYRDLRAADLNIYDFQTGIRLGFDDDIQNAEITYRPLAWSSTGTTVWLVRTALLSGLSTRFELVTFDLLKEQFLAQGLVFTTYELVPATVPLPPAIESAYLFDITFTPNPVFSEWVALGISAIDAAYVSTPEDLSTDTQLMPEAEFSQIILWNTIRNDFISVSQQLIPGQALDPVIHWHPDGSLFTMFPQSAMLFVQFDSAQEQIAIVETFPDRTDDALLGWVGVDTLLLYSNLESETGIETITIRQIQEGALLEKEFYRTAPELVISSSDFHLSAAPSEQYVLSCLFDQALPTQLALGQHGRFAPAAFSNDLRDGPFILFSTALGQATAEAEFTIVDGPACSGGYRFWQIALDDSTVGWAAEASRSEYFMEQAPSVAHP